MNAKHPMLQRAIQQMRRISRRHLAPAVALATCLMGVSGCVHSTNLSINPLPALDSKRFAGTWYEIVRLNNPVEGGLTRESVTFLPLPLNRWQLIHRGWRNEAGAWEVRTVEARPANPKSSRATLRGRFHGLFRSNIHIIWVDPNYQHALISGDNRDEFWILSRTPSPDPKMIESMLQEAKSKGFPVHEALFLQFE